MLIKDLNVLGRKVVLDEYGLPKVVNDGVTIARAIELPEWRTLVLLLSERTKVGEKLTVAYDLMVISKSMEVVDNLANEVLLYQARIEADRLLAEKLQEEEREQFTIEERAKFLHDTIAAQRKFLAQQRSEAIRNRPPTKNQLRNQMMTYLKHVGNFKHSDLKTKKFEEIQALYEKIKRSDEDFISIGSAEDERLIKKMNEKGIDSSKNEMVKEEDKEEEGSKKRKGGHIKMIARKKARKQSDIDSDDEHKKCLKIVTFESILNSKIMEKKLVIARLNKVSSPDGDYLVIYRANGNFRALNYLMEVRGFEAFHKEDVKDKRPFDDDARFMDDVLENPQLPHHCNPPPFIYPNCLSESNYMESKAMKRKKQTKVELHVIFYEM
ncbi:hypothetical protein Tco_0443564 [Tanacetum coccineum]